MSLSDIAAFPFYYIVDSPHHQSFPTRRSSDLTAHRHFLTADLTTWISKITNVSAGADGLTTSRPLRWGSPERERPQLHWSLGQFPVASLSLKYTYIL